VLDTSKVVCLQMMTTVFSTHKKPGVITYLALAEQDFELEREYRAVFLTTASRLTFGSLLEICHCT
jgi:hypothetical protein